jgi:hypothetical protein
MQSKILTAVKQKHKKETTVRRKTNLEEMNHLGKLHSIRRSKVCAVGWGTMETSLCIGWQSGGAASAVGSLSSM